MKKEAAVLEQKPVFNVGQQVVAQWYDDGMRAAPAKIETSVLSQSGEHVTLTLYAPLQPSRFYTLEREREYWRGPRDFRFDLRAPNEAEAVSTARIIAQREREIQEAADRPRRKLAEEEEKSAQLSAKEIALLLWQRLTKETGVKSVALAKQVGQEVEVVKLIMRKLRDAGKVRLIDDGWVKQ